MFPQEQNVMLQKDSPLILSFTICGNSQDFVGLSYRIIISRGGAIRQMFPVINGTLALVLDSDTGIVATVWSAESTVYERCVEVPVRVDADHPEIVDSSVELRFTRGTNSSPIGAYIYYLLQPSVVETATTARETDAVPTGAGGDTATDTEPSQTTTTATTLATTVSTPQGQRISTVDTSVLGTSQPSSFVNKNSIYIIAGLGSALLVTVVVIVLLVVCVIRRRRNNTFPKTDLESSIKSSSDDSESKREDAIMLALHWNQASPARQL